MAKAPPSFNLYPGDLIKSCVDMDAAEFGSYMRLMCYQWEHGSIPNRVDKLARICGMDRADFEPLWDCLASRFDDVEGGNLKVQSRLAEQREKDIATWQKRKSGGAKGGRPKKGVGDSGEKQKPQGYGQGSVKKTSTERGKGKREKGNIEKNESLIEELKAIEIPSELDSPGFREAWSAWVDHKQDPNSKPSAWSNVTGAKAQLTRLKSHGADSAAAGIWLAISEDWEGIWPDRVPNRGDTAMTPGQRRVAATQQAIEDFANG